VLDAGALIAIERGDRRITARVKGELEAGRVPRTHAGVIGQVWRGGRGHQARLAGALHAIDIRAIDDDIGRRAGELLGHARRSDVIDAAVVVIADEDDEIFTADTADLAELAAASGKIVHLTRI
jgi:hypothetical protein